jgi:hypothetical protein
MISVTVRPSWTYVGNGEFVRLVGGLPLRIQIASAAEVLEAEIQSGREFVRELLDV